MSKILALENEVQASYEVIRAVESSLNISYTILDNQPQLLLITNDIGRIYKANNTSCQYFDQTAGSLIGADVADFVSESTGERFKAFFQKLGELNPSLSFYEEDVFKGMYIHWQLNCLNFEQHTSKIVLIIGNDITDLKKAYLDLSELKEQ